MSFHRYNSSRCCKLKLTYHFHFEFLFDLISDSVIFPQRKSMMGSAACADWVRKVAQLTQVCKESLSVNFDSYFQFIGEEECTIWMARELHVQEISINTHFISFHVFQNFDILGQKLAGIFNKYLVNAIKISKKGNYQKITIKCFHSRSSVELLSKSIKILTII